MARHKKESIFKIVAQKDELAMGNTSDNILFYHLHTANLYFLCKNFGFTLTYLASPIIKSND